MTFENIIRRMVESSCIDVLSSFYSDKAKEILPEPCVTEINFKDCEQGKYFSATLVVNRFHINPFEIIKTEYKVGGFVSENIEVTHVFEYRSGQWRMAWSCSETERDLWDMPILVID